MRISSLHTYPVKGCRRLDHHEAEVEPWGLAGDRRWMAIDPDGIGITQRTASNLALLSVSARPGGLRFHAPGRPDLDVDEPVDGPTEFVRVFSSKPPVSARRLGRADVGAWLSEFLGRPARRRFPDGLLFGLNLIPDVAPGESGTIRVGEPVLDLP